MDATRLLDQKLHSYQGATLDPRLYVLIPAEFLMNGGENRMSSGLIQNRRRPGWQVRLHALLEMQGRAIGQDSGHRATAWIEPGPGQS